MKRRVSANTRLLHDLFTQYPSTFRAFCELVNNSIQADSRHIDITIEYSGEQQILPTAISKIIIRDDGHGVPINQLQEKLLDFGDSSKKGGKGVGRFAALQIGSSVEIETIGFDEKEGVYSKVRLPFHERHIKSVKKVEELIIDTEEVLLKGKNHKTYYKVTITDIYDPVITGRNQKRKISEKLLQENIFNALLERYPLLIFNRSVVFSVNGKKLDPNDFVEGQPEKAVVTYTDRKEAEHELSFSHFKLKSAIEEVRVFLTTKNAGVDSIVSGFEFEADWLSPESAGWLVYIHADNLPTDLYRNTDLDDMDEEGAAFKKFIKGRLTEFFKSRNKEYEEFVRQLQKDSYYPYKEEAEATSRSKVMLFEKLAFLVEKKYSLMGGKNKLREIVYPLIDRTILTGELDKILQKVLRLDNKHVKQFNAVLARAEMEDLIEFSEKVSKKTEDLDFIEKLACSPLSKYILERKELHKVLEKTLWIFGEQYLDNTTLLSDKNLENNLRSLAQQTMSYKPLPKEDNLNMTIDKKEKSITDLFLYSEKPIDEARREVLIVELKAPKVKISPVELQQVLRYAQEIENSPFYTEDIAFNIILISTEINQTARYQLDSVPRPRENPYFYFQNVKKNITVSVMKWSQLIENNKRKLRYLSAQLKVKDIGVEEKIRTDFDEIRFDRLKSVLRKVSLVSP